MQHKRGKEAAHERWGGSFALASRPTPCACLTPQLMREGEAKLLMREGEDKHEGGGGQAARPAGRWPSRKSPYLTAPI